MNDRLSNLIKQLPPHELALLKWRLQRRPEQTLPMPGEAPLITFLLGGRGSGKTKTGANHVFEYACNLPWTPKYRQVRVALVGNIYDDVKKTMIEGDSGLLSVIPEESIIKWNRTIGELTVRVDGPNDEYREIIFSSYTATSPQKLRGPQQHIAWWDEPAKAVDSDVNPMEAETTWTNLIMGLRLGEYPHLVVTGTPTPCKLVKFLIDHPDCVTTRMTTWANRANLPEAFRKELERLDPNSRTYRQEVLAEILLDNPDSLFPEEAINAGRIEPPRESEAGIFKVLGWDPSLSSSEDADEAGIILTAYTPEVRARAKENSTGGGRPLIIEPAQAYIIGDYSGHLTPAQQTDKVIRIVLEEKVEDLVIETNQGSDFLVTQLTQALKDQTQEFHIRKHKKARATDWGSIKRWTVKATLSDGSLHTFMISGISATRSKKIRAETASYQMDFGRIHLPLLENDLPLCDKEACRTSLAYEMSNWNPNKSTGRSQSPNRLDAFVYTILFIFGRHTLPTQSKLIGPAHNRAAQPTSELTDAQKNPGLQRRAASSIYSRDLTGGRGGRAGFSDGLGRLR